MPELDLAGWPERSNYSAFLGVLATMLFPNDESQRMAVSTLPGEVSPNHPAADLAVAKYLEGFHNGVWAGEVLFVVRIIAERHPEVEASISKAAIVIEANARRIKRCSLDGARRFWADEKTIRTAFYKYRSVAHLWTACSLMAHQFTLPSMQVLDDLDIAIAVEKTIEDLGVFLAVSENMRRFGEGHVLPRRKDMETLLNPAASWRPALGAPLPDISVTVPPLPPAALKDLNSYRARVRKSM
jgi:hypothetical protein